MLRITMQDMPESLTFLVEGKLVGDWAKELEQCWNQTAPVRGHRALIIDLSETLFIDQEGRRVLSTLFREGAFFRTACPMTESIVSEITRKPSGAWRGALMQCLLLLLLVAGSKGAQPPAQNTPLSLTPRDAVQMALKQNPQVQIANLKIAVSQENQIVARSALLPQANFAVSETLQRDNLEAFTGMRFQGFPQHSGPFWQFQGGANGSMPLFDLAAWHRWRQSRENTTGARAQDLAVRELNVQLVVSQYLGSLRASADVSAAQSRVELAKALFDQASDLQKNGAGTGIDTLRANVQYQNERQRPTSLFALARLSVDTHQPVELADFWAEQDARVLRLALNGLWSEEDIELKKLGQQQAKLEAAKSEVDVANLGMDLARGRFQASVANNIEVITALDESARATDNQIAALYRYNQAGADLAHATGQMESLYTQ